MKVTIIIPTCSSERLPGLMRTIESIRAGTYKNIHIVIIADGDPRIHDFVSKRFDDISVILNKERMEYVASFNMALKKFESEYYVYACDDIIFPPDCIEIAMMTMQQNFVTGNGVVSLHKAKKATIGLFGREWAERFPDRQAFCPDYMHYSADAEMSSVAQELGIFTSSHEDRKKRVRHVIIRYDKTWRLVEEVRLRDRDMKRKRREKGYKWGINFNLITK